MRLSEMDRLRRKVASAMDAAFRAEGVAWAAFHRTADAAAVAPTRNDAQKAIHALVEAAKDKSCVAAYASCDAESAIRHLAEVLGVTDKTPRAKRRKP